MFRGSSGWFADKLREHGRKGISQNLVRIYFKENTFFTLIMRIEESLNRCSSNHKDVEYMLALVFVQ